MTEPTNPWETTPLMDMPADRAEIEKLIHRLFPSYQHFTDDQRLYLVTLHVAVATIHRSLWPQTIEERPK